MHPKRFSEELKRFDPRLDFVWNKKENRWEVIGFDRRNIRYLIMPVPMGKLNEVGPQVIESLYNNSPHKQGGAAALNRLMDEEQEREEALEESRLASAAEYATAEAYNSLKRRTGSRIINSGVPELIVRDRRRVKLEEKPALVGHGGKDVD